MFGIGVVSALALAVPVIQAPLVSAAESVRPTPGSVWVAPKEVKRVPVGGPPPERDPRESAVAMTGWCGSPNKGVLPDYPMERFKVSDRLQFGVNLADGNLWWQHRGLTIRGTGLNLNLGYSFNGQAAFGPDWRFTAGRDMALHLGSSVVAMPVDTGACVNFWPRADGTYDPGDHGSRVNLVKNPAVPSPRDSSTPVRRGRSTGAAGP
ncbi:hypothetical protein Aglo02_42520 [Actinokineospora globicatena]|nr:hypothetical protein Aglo02_42520 [Actinokineospora globicatena]